MQALKNHL